MAFLTPGSKNYVYLKILPIFNLALTCFAILILSSCLRNNPATITPGQRLMQTVDSLMETGNGKAGMKLLVNKRKVINSDDPAISACYRLLATYNSDRPALMNSYADSALAYFNSQQRMDENANEYYKCLLIKGDAYLKAKKYISALDYYYKAKEKLSGTSCDEGDIDSKMGVIYYNQHNFRRAASCWAESYKHLMLCSDKMMAQKLFGLQAAALNNAGFSYERAGLLDSAMFFYNKNLELISQADSLHLMNKENLAGKLQVLYDNLGGLHLKKGNLVLAEQYLNRCLNMQAPDDDGIRIPPMLKLADLYLKIGKDDKALTALNGANMLLNKFRKNNPESDIKWHKLYAQYLYKIGQAQKSYGYLNRYIELRDSVDNNSSDLYRLDVEHELNRIGQQQQLTELQEQNKIKKMYLVVIGMGILLAIAAMYLINRNLQRTKKTQMVATARNEQLQQTLDELEKANKNYIRMMRVMAHDLRNPLSGITGLAAMLQDDESASPENKHALRLIETTGLNTIEMINELLKWGLSDDHSNMPKTPVDLAGLLFDATELLQFRANEKQQQIVFEGDNTPVIVPVNHEKISRVVNNLIVNAIKFSHNCGVIKVGLTQQKGRVTIYVADNGVGIPEKDKEKIFEMFTAAKKPGTNGEEPFGLGLSISKRIVELHKGKLWFNSEVGKGTTFFIELPL